MNDIMQKIDFENWHRKERFLGFKNNPCSYSVGIEYEFEFQKKPYICLIFAITKTINELQEFRVHSQNNELYYFKKLEPYYTIFNKNTENFINICTNFNENFNDFYNSCLYDIEIYKNQPSLNPQKNLGQNLLHISAIPWFSMTSFNLNLKNGYDYYLPIFTISQIKNNNFKLFIQVNHSTIDGFHIHKFDQCFRENLLSLHS